MVIGLFVPREKRMLVLVYKYRYRCIDTGAQDTSDVKDVCSWGHIY